MNESEAQRKKRRYSRNGCSNCKKRKIKCDESKPACNKCVKSNLDCVYKKNYIFKNDDTKKLTNSSLNSISEGSSRNTSMKSTGNSLCNSHNPDTKKSKDLKFQFQKMRWKVSDNGMPPNKKRSTIKFPIQTEKSNEEDEIENKDEDDDEDEGDKDISEQQRDKKMGHSVKIKTEYNNNNNNNSDNGVDLQYFQNQQNKNYQNLSQQSVDEAMILEHQFTNDITNLITNQENLVSDLVSNIQSIPDFDIDDFNFQENETNLMINDHFKYSNLSYDFNESLKNSFDDLKFNSICKNLNISTTSIEYTHLKSFMTNVQSILYPLATSYLKSPFITPFIEESTNSLYLKYAMLASGARFLFEKFKIDRLIKNSARVVDNHQSDRIIGSNDSTNTAGADYDDEELHSMILLNDKYRIYYLTQCFKYLQLSLDNIDFLNENISSAILTSLLLCSDLSSNENDDKWELHLKGAKQFLNKYYQFQFQNKNNKNSLILSSYLFSSLEICSGLNLPNNKSLEFEDFEKWLPIPLNHGPIDILKKLGLVIDGYIIENDDNYFSENGGGNLNSRKNNASSLNFNDPHASFDYFGEGIQPHRREAKHEESVKNGSFKMYFGYSDDVIKISKIIILLKKFKKEKLTVDEITKLFKLVDISKNYKIITNKPPFIIPTESKYHPYYDGEDKSKLVLSCYYELDRTWYSIFDFINHIHIDSLVITILTSEKFLNLSYTDDLVTGLLDRIIDYFFFVKINENIDMNFIEKYYNSTVRINKYLKNKQDNNISIKEFDILFNQFHLNEDDNYTFLDFDKYVKYKFDHRICMFQWCLVTIGMCCNKASHKLLVESLLFQLWKLGVKSARNSIIRVRKVWFLRRLRYEQKRAENINTVSSGSPAESNSTVKTSLSSPSPSSRSSSSPISSTATSPSSNYYYQTNSYEGNMKPRSFLQPIIIENIEASRVDETLLFPCTDSFPFT
ncbi:hypothetical protein BVG19_g3166 [[Candida] boidinii]|nr:hypothetical protein BVG19_g3166 [[Candida] boidinii]OWB52449.1 transcription factor activity, sequence-specific DNA binding protein [[Candida] boidinii]